jgi:hypothetical protein
VPDGVRHPDGQAALELVEAAGLILDPWQKLVLEQSLLQAGGKWAAFEVGLVCPRQNGKNALIEARELAGLFVLGEGLIIHSAHLADTAKEAFRRLEELIGGSEWLSREVKHVWHQNGHESIELKSGQRVRFRTRTKGGGRGFSGDCVIFDEAMVLGQPALAAILPIVSARPNPQVWYTGSAVDQDIHDDGVVLARVRDRGVKGGDPSLAFFEWSVAAANPYSVDDRDMADPKVWAEANPALGVRISEAHIANELRSMDRRTFAVERLGVGDWPKLDQIDEYVIDPDAWDLLADARSEIAEGLCLAFDVSPDRAWASISAAGVRADGLKHVEVVDRRRGTGWLPGRLAELDERHRPDAVIYDGVGPAGSLAADIDAEGVPAKPVTAREHADACGILFDAVEQRELRHLGTSELRSALRGATSRPMGDRWAWSRRHSGVDITPLVASTLALWAAATSQSGTVWVGFGDSAENEEPVAV